MSTLKVAVVTPLEVTEALCIVRRKSWRYGSASSSKRESRLRLAVAMPPPLLFQCRGVCIGGALAEGEGEIEGD